MATHASRGNWRTCHVLSTHSESALAWDTPIPLFHNTNVDSFYPFSKRISTSFYHLSLTLRLQRLLVANILNHFYFRLLDENKQKRWYAGFLRRTGIMGRPFCLHEHMWIIHVLYPGSGQYIYHVRYLSVLCLESRLREVLASDHQRLLTCSWTTFFVAGRSHY